jgi:hypothetical protein
MTKNLFGEQGIVGRGVLATNPKKYQHFSLDYTDCINEHVACSILYKKRDFIF